MSKHNARRFRKLLIASAVIALILLALLYLLRSVLVGPHIQRFLENTIESQLGVRVAIGDIGGSYITDFQVANVTTLESTPVGRLVDLELRLLRVSYHPLSILKGLEAFLGEATAEIEGAKLEFDLSPQNRISTTPSETASSQSFFLPRRLPRISVAETSIFLKGQGYGTAFKGIELETRHLRKMTSAIQLHIKEWSWTHPDLKDGNSPVTAVIEYSREKITAKSLRLGEKELAESVEIGLKGLPEMVSFDTKLNLAGGQVALEGKLGRSDLHALVDLEHLDLERISAFLNPEKLPISGKLSTKADVVLPWQRQIDLAADLDLKLVDGAVYGLAADELALRATAKDGEFRLDRLDLRSGANHIAIQELRGPVEALFQGDFAGVGQTLAGKFSVDCQDVPSLLLQVKTDLSPTVDSIPPHRLSLSGELNRGDIILSSGSLTTDSGFIRLDPSRVALPAKNRPLRDSSIQGALKINLPDLGVLGRVFAVPKLGGSLQGTAAITGTLGAPRGTAVVFAKAISFKDTDFGDATARLQANGQRITVETLELLRSKDRVSLTGSFDLTSRNLEDVNIQITVADIATYAKNLISKELSLTGSIHGSLKISGPLKEPDGQVDVSLKKLHLIGVDIPQATLKARSSGRRITINLAEASTPVGAVNLTGHLQRGPADAQFDLEITSLTLYEEGSLLALDGPGHIRFSRNGELSVQDISLSGPSGSISLNGAAAGRGKVDFHMLVSDFNSEGWLESYAADRLRFSGLNASIHLFGAMDSPSLAVAGDLARIDSTRERTFLSGRFDLSYTKEQLTIRQFEWTGQEGEKLSITGALPVNLLGKTAMGAGGLSLDAKVNLPDLDAVNFFSPDYIPPTGSLHGEIHLSGSWDAPSGKIVFQGRGLGQPPHIRAMPPGPLDILGHIRLDGDRLVVESIQIDSPSLIFTSKGDWTGKSFLVDLVNGVLGKLEGDVALTGNLEVTDLSWIAGEISGLRRVSGRLEAEVKMEGEASNPALNGSVRLSDGELRLDADVPSLGAIDLEAAVTPASLQLKTLTGELGGARFQVSGSVVRKDKGDGIADLRLRGDNLLFYRSEGVKVRADTDLAVKGPFSRLELAGEVAITDGRFVKYFDFLSALQGSGKPKTNTGLQLFAIREPPLSNTLFDVSITSKHPFRIHNNLAKGSVRPDLKLTGTGEAPILAGKIYVEPTRLILPAGSLIFESGVIRLDPNSPDRPTLDLLGRSRMLGYDITVLVEGPYDEPVVTLSSVPPLSNEELLLLVLTGQQPKTNTDRAASQGRTMNVAVFVGRDFISRWFASESVEAGESILDRFQIEVGRAVTRGGEETLDAQFRLTQGIISDGDTLYLTGEKDVFDFYNAGVKIVFRFK
jgi:autotransporter translocation and assembly factor TamB